MTAPGRNDSPSRAAHLLTRYWLVALTLAVSVLSASLASAGASTAAAWSAGAFTLLVAAGYTVRMVRTLRAGGLGVDLLAVVAIVATVLVGEFAAALIVVLMLAGGEALEDYANRRARRELDSLLRRDPRSAHRYGEDGSAVEDVPIDAVRVGDVLLVRPAEVVPVDAVLLDARAAFDMSSITGESLPADKEKGDDVPSGSVNGTAAVRVRAARVAADSQYQQIVALVAQASRTKARVVRIADRFAVPFTLSSLLLGGVAWFVSGDPVRFAEVLVLASPCPLIIAAPVAFIGGMSRAAKAGIIVRDGGVLERLADAKTVVFDKTGTLTTGRPVLREIRPAEGFAADDLLALAASAEQYSSHVLAASIVAAATDRSLRLSRAASADERATDGVVARIGAHTVAVGKFSFIRALAPDTRRERISPGELAVYVSVDGAYAGALIERDPPRENATEMLRDLAALGTTNVELLTGDAQETAAGIADELGIARYRAECLPADKVARVASITERPVAMVGDGVNDAPVLASADVGIAMGAKGATAASESADVVILVDDIGKVVEAISIARRTVAVALQSIWLGIAASILLMCIAAFGVIPAVVGALLQEVVDLATILAALRAAATPRSDQRPYGRPELSGMVETREP
ncbi:heavy metal translocating P-type ATPase [Leifsonia sp. NPDC077715]|uniref:heavy metal translocating P-type ATPase n=1 Tax=Leifsonia sp. NPDC077715 TaxID=3155539 RepID=UPI00343F0422